MGFRKKPKGSARLPKWWLEATPHNVRDDHGIFPLLRTTTAGNQIRGRAKSSPAVPVEASVSAPAPVEAPPAEQEGGPVLGAPVVGAPAETPTPVPAALGGPVVGLPVPGPAPAAMDGPVLGAPVVGAPVPAPVELGAPVPFPGPAPAPADGPVLGAPVVGAPVPAPVELGAPVAAPTPASFAEASGEFEEVVDEIIEEEIVDEIIEEEYIEETADDGTANGSVEELEQRLARKSEELRSMQSSSH